MAGEQAVKKRCAIEGLVAGSGPAHYWHIPGDSSPQPTHDFHII